MSQVYVCTSGLRLFDGVLQQWWSNGNGGEWRCVPYVDSDAVGDGEVPPQLAEVREPKR